MPGDGTGRDGDLQLHSTAVWAIRQLQPEISLSAFNLCFAACKALNRKAVTSTDLLFLLAGQHTISQQSRPVSLQHTLIRSTRASSDS